MISDRIKKLSPYKTETTRAKVRLSSNELPLLLPEDVRKRIGEEVSKIPLNRYPDPKADELREIIAQHLGVKKENLVLGNGSDELIYYLSIAVGEFDRGVFYPIPTFPMYEISARLLGRSRVEVALSEDKDIDLEASIRSIRRFSPILAFISYPNNPTANCFSREKIEKIRQEGLFTVIDEAYFHFSKKTFLKDASSREDTVVLRTLSKIGMAGLRIGILVAKEDIAHEINKMRLPFNITYPSQVIARLMLTEFYHLVENCVSMVIRERERILVELSKIEGIEPYPSDANFILFRSHIDADTLHKELLRRGVLVRNVSHLPTLENCLRVSVGLPEENDAFLEALEDAIRSFI
ncbi:MAG: histidinol-phosphate transaminase [Hydrogenobacter sp.]|uniref:histidinol-phosphate transaminase n=1 Tax=Hydrogenobacter thermophilus TaxID=940 RepID=UPI0030FA3F95